MSQLFFKQIHSPYIITGSFFISGSVSASYFIGDGSGLTGISINTSSFITNSQTSSMVVASSSYAATASVALNIPTINTSSFVTNSQTSSMTVLSASYASQSQNSTSSSYSSKLEGGKINYVPLWNGINTQTSSSIYQSGSNNISINTNIFDSTNPETLLVSGSGINVISGKVNINNYTQLNIVNKNAGNNASSDLVATNDTGGESGNYVDLGINSSGFGGLVGGPNDAYLYTTGSNFLIGNITSGAVALKLFSGNNATIFPVIVTGSVAIITGSLQGSSSYAISASYAPSQNTTPPSLVVYMYSNFI